jgi:hypothetical protein
VQIKRHHYRKGLEAFVRWLAENPLEPSQKDALALRDIAIITSKGYDQVQPTAASEAAVVMEWQRRMFLAPEFTNPIVAQIKQTLQGCTLTSGDAVELIDAVRNCTSPEPD